MPGKSLPESFTPASRLKSDSIRSPTTAQTLRTTPRMTACGHFMPNILSPTKCVKARLASVENKIAPPNPSHVFAGADAGDHLVFADQRANRVSAGVAELRHKNEVEHVEFSRAFMACRKYEELDFLHEVQQPGHIHEAEQRRRDGENSRRVAFRNELSQTKTQHEQNQETGLKIIHSRRRALRADHAGELKKRSRHQQHAAKESPIAEANELALGNESVEFNQARDRQEHHHAEEEIVRDDLVAGKHREQNDGPQHERAGEAANENFGFGRTIGVIHVSVPFPKPI
jgi:hypothetical protein